MPGHVLAWLVAWTVVAPADALATQRVYTSPGAATFTVPAGVTSLQVTAIGGSGGAGDVGPNSAPAPGGAGATVTATLATRPGQTLALFVGSDGGQGGAGSQGGAPDGGQGGVYAGGGGGSSSVSLCPSAGCTDLTPAALIAAGGGGGGAAGSDGAAGSGGAAGANGTAGATGAYDGGGGGGFAGPSQTGGAAGIPAALDNDGATGGVGAGGSGGTGGGDPSDPTSLGEGGGGGGGGLTGGTGGGSGGFSYLGPDYAAGGGGGGGQSLVPAGGTSSAVSGQAPEIAITYTPAPTASISSPANNRAFEQGQVVQTSFSCSEGEGGPGLSSCQDSISSPSPGHLNSSATGRHTYTVTATSLDGERGVAHLSYTVVATDGSGRLSTLTHSVTHGALHQRLAFTYTAATGGMSAGAVTLLVPSGWSAPSATKTSPGYVTASSGHVSVSGRTITVSGLTRATGKTVTITYGSKASGGQGARAPSAAVGAQTWPAQEKSVPGGVLTKLAAPPKITIT